MNFLETDARRVDLGVRRYKEATRKSLFTAPAWHRGGSSVHQQDLLHADVLPVRILVDLGNVPDVRIRTTVVVENVVGLGGRGRGWSVGRGGGGGGSGGVLGNFDG